MLASSRRASFAAVSLLAALPLVRLHAPRSQESRAEVPELLAPRTVVLVRHAEKSTTGDARDPELSEAGRARAEELARVLASASATRLVATEFRRTQATLAPLAEELHLTVDTRPASALEELASELARSAPGSVSVVAGHSNTIPALAARLGVVLPGTTDTARGPQLGDDEYDRLFVLYLPPEGSPVRPSVLELRYGS